MTNLRSVIGVFDPETEGDEESRRGSREAPPSVDP